LSTSTPPAPCRPTRSSTWESHEDPHCRDFRRRLSRPGRRGLDLDHEPDRGLHQRAGQRLLDPDRRPDRLSLRVWVPVTGTLAQATAAIPAAASNAIPAKVARLNREAAGGTNLIEQTRATRSQVIGSAWPQASAVITNALELIQLQLDDLEERLNRTAK
jgi:hypothetical protein